jgi:signal transduction histidine kinase
MTAPLDPSARDAQQGAPARADALAELLDYCLHTDDEEKRMLARQLHDKLGSSLTALSMHLSLMAQQLPPDPVLQERAALVKQLLGKIIEGNRALQSSLWNDTFEFLGIKAALQEMAEQFGAQHGLAVRASLPEHELDCPRELGLVLLRGAQQGLANIALHAGATEAELVLDESDDGWMLTVRDNGKGVEGEVAAAGHGLRLLRERLRPFGGGLALQANAQGAAGASLVLTLPRPQPTS